MGCLVVTSNSVKLKSISSWPNFRAKTTENHFRFHFHFKWLPALENRREREREKERGRKKEEITNAKEDITGTANALPRCANRDRAIFVRIWWFFSGFCLCFEEWMILYIHLVIEKMWENMSKQVENVFSMVFSRTQPNIRKYFPKHFLKCNQTHENIFLSENTFTRTKRSLICLPWQSLAFLKFNATKSHQTVNIFALTGWNLYQIHSMDRQKWYCYLE